MHKSLLFSLILLLFTVTNSQSQEVLKQYPVKKGPKNEIFDKAFTGILASGPEYFRNFQNGTGIKSIIDTTYDVKFNFQEKNEGRLICEKHDVNLSIRFALDNSSLKTFISRLNASMPKDFVYTLEYDAPAKQSTYNFFEKPTSALNPIYPIKICLITDVNNTASLTFLMYR